MSDLSVVESTVDFVLKELFYVDERERRLVPKSTNRGISFELRDQIRKRAAGREHLGEVDGSTKLETIIKAILAQCAKETNHAPCDDYCRGIQFMASRVSNIITMDGLADETLAELT